MPSVKVVDTKGKDKGAVELTPDVFGVEIRVPLLHQAVVRELADRRAGTHDTRGERGLGWRQEAVEAEGHRPRAPGQHPRHAVEGRRQAVRSDAAQLRASLAAAHAPRGPARGGSGEDRR